MPISLQVTFPLGVTMVDLPHLVYGFQMEKHNLKLAMTAYMHVHLIP